MSLAYRLDEPLGYILDQVEDPTNPGALPTFASDDQPTVNRCVTCGTDLDQSKAQFDRGVDHALSVMRKKLATRMPADEAEAVIAWVRRDVEL